MASSTRRKSMSAASTKDSVPLGHIGGRGIVLGFQRGFRQLCPVARYGHDLKLYCSDTVAGQQVNGQLETAVHAAIAQQLGVLLVRGTFQFSEYMPIAVPSKNKSPFHISEPGCLVGERRQFVHQRHFADAGADIVHGIEAVSQVGNGRHPGAAPGVGAFASGNGGEKHGCRTFQFFRREGEKVHAAVVGCYRQPGYPDTPLDQRHVISPGHLRNRAVQQTLQKQRAFAGEQQGSALLVNADKSQAHQILPLRFCDHAAQILRPDELAPAQQTQCAHISLAEDHLCPASFRQSLRGHSCGMGGSGPQSG